MAREKKQSESYTRKRHGNENMIHAAVHIFFDENDVAPNVFHDIVT